jgi:Zn-finger nucleic acid-binding protein
MRPCPTCDKPLIEVARGGQRVDRCPTCHGIFFDAGELEAIVAMMDLYHSIKLEEDEIDIVPSEERTRRVSCPADGADMEPRQVGTLTMDTCPSCDGIWLDDGELVSLMLAEQNIRDNLNLYIRLGE